MCIFTTKRVRNARMRTKTNQTGIKMQEKHNSGT